jgi:hypothetical protein
VTGTLSITDNASGNPQTISLSGTGTLTSLTGQCLSGDVVNRCQTSQNLSDCPAGQPVAQPTSTSCGLVDISAGCKFSRVAQGVCTVH